MLRLIRASALVAAAHLTPAAAQTGKPAPAEVTVLAGGYELANEAGDRKCLVLLRPASTQGGYAIGFPAQCRVALPVLASIAAWTPDLVGSPATARIRLRNMAGMVVLDFAETTDDGNAIARDAEKAAFALKPTVGASIAERVRSVPPPRPVVSVTATATKTPVATLVAATPRDAPAMSHAAGDYTLLRDKGRETGCTISLHDGKVHSGAGEDGRAELAAGCPDKGLTQFSPAGWRITSGTLWLTGLKGQRLSFERNRRSGWDKGPGQGEALVLAPK